MSGIDDSCLDKSNPMFTPTQAVQEMFDRSACQQNDTAKRNLLR